MNDIIAAILVGILLPLIAIVGGVAGATFIIYLYEVNDGKDS